MKYIFRDKLYQGTRQEIKDQMIIDLRDLLNYSPPCIQQELDKISRVYDFEIGPDVFTGTKEEIMDQVIRVQKIAPIVSTYGCWVNILGVNVYVQKGKHIDSAKDKVIDKIREMINEL